jgi:hypothetical protein
MPSKDSSPSVITTPIPALVPLLRPASGMFPAAVDELECADVIVGAGADGLEEVWDAKFQPLSWTPAIFEEDCTDKVVVIQLCESSWTA